MTRLKWGSRSLKAWDGVHPALRETFDRVLATGFDVTAVSGVRTTAAQKKLYDQGRTKDGPIVTHVDGVLKKSKHQIKPDGYGHAIDVYPYPIDLSRRYYSTVRFYFLAGLVKAISNDLYESGEIENKIKWGGDWDSDQVFGDQHFYDLPHFELVG
jgi:peptidoglycan L-alanyl-D-glutamate endopeptidase CwlK